MLHNYVKHHFVELLLQSHLYVKQMTLPTLAGVAQWIERGLQTKGSLVRFPVRVHASVAGQVPSGGGGSVRGSRALMILSLFFLSPFSSL